MAAPAKIAGYAVRRFKTSSSVSEAAFFAPFASIDSRMQALLDFPGDSRG